MGNESSSPLNGRYDDDETTIDGTVFSNDTRETGLSGVSRDTGSRFYRSTGRAERSGNPLGAMLSGNLFDSICGNNFFEDDEEDDDHYNSNNSRRKKDKDKEKDKDKDKEKGRRGRRKERRKNRDESNDESYYSDVTEESGAEEKRHSKSSKSRKEKQSKTSIQEDDEPDTKESSSTTMLSKEPNDSNGKAGGNNGKDFSLESSGPALGKATGPGTPAKTALAKPLASSFAKRCYFTKAGIGKNMQHYEGITLTGNTVLMLASAMKLKGCPTICDEDLRRVEQTYPNQFSRLPDELLLSSGWRRISKYCYFSGKPIPDGVPFFHSRERCHPNGGYYFLLAASIGMERPSDVEPLTLDMLILLQTDFPTQCDQAPTKLIEDPLEWTLVTRFCFFSGGPINSEEDVYYKADFNNNFIFMLAFLSPNMTPEELYRLNDITGEKALKSVAAVEEVETVYDLTDRDFDDLKMYHLGPCRALPDQLLSPDAWEKVLPQHFMECRENALARAYEYEAHAQEAIAKAGKLVGMGQAKEQSYNTVPNHQELPYNSNYPQTEQQQTSHMEHQLYTGSNQVLDTQKQNVTQTNNLNSYVEMHQTQQQNVTQTNDQNSYIEMHQIGDTHGSSYRSSGEEGTFGVVHQQKYEGGYQGLNNVNDAYNQVRNSYPSQDSQAGSYPGFLNGAFQDDPTADGVIFDDQTERTVTHADDPPIEDEYHRVCSTDPPAGDSIRENNTVFDEEPTICDISTVGDTIYHTEGLRMGGSSHTGDPSIPNFLPQDDDPTIGDIMTLPDHRDDLRMGGLNHVGDPSIRDFETQADDPSVGDIMTQADQIEDTRIGGLNHVGDPSIRDFETQADDPTVGDHMIVPDHAEDNRMGGLSRVGDPSIRNFMPEADDPSVGDIMTQDDDPTLVEADDPTMAESDDPTLAEADDPTLAEADDPTLAEADDPTLAEADSDDGALDNYYKGIEEQENQLRHEELQSRLLDYSPSSSNSQKSFADDSLHQVKPDNPQSQYEETESYHGDEDMPSTPQESKYMGMQKLDNTPPESMYNPPKESPLRSTHSDPPEMQNYTHLDLPVKRNNVHIDPPEIDNYTTSDPPEINKKNKIEPTKISTYAGYGFARQFSSTPRRVSSSSPKYATPPKFFQQVQQKTSQVTHDDPTLDNMYDDDPSPRIPMRTPTSFSSYEDKNGIGSPLSRGSKSAISPDSLTHERPSSAMKGARELLRKNRQERLALMSKRKGGMQKAPVHQSSSQKVKSPSFGNENKEPEKSPKRFSHIRSRSVTPSKKRPQVPTSPLSPAKKNLRPVSPPYDSIQPKTPPSSQRNTNRSVFFNSPRSDVSGVSSCWTDEPDSADRDSRRALILKMAKNRMRSKKEMRSPSLAKSPIELD